MNYKKLEKILVELGFKDGIYDVVSNSGRKSVPILELKIGSWDFNFMYFKEGKGLNDDYRCRVVTQSKENIMCDKCKDKADVIVKLIKHTQQKSYKQGKEDIKSQFKQLFDIVKEE